MNKALLTIGLITTLALTGCGSEKQDTTSIIEDKPFIDATSSFIGEPGTEPENAIIEEEKTPKKKEKKKEATNLPIKGLYTDTSKHNIELDQILSGGPGKDGIPSIDEPKFTTIQSAAVDDEVLGIFVEFDGVQKFYPYTILVWHEIVNDSIGNNHFAVTFCPLCGSAIVFDRNIEGELTTFGVSGLLYQSNLLMYDSATESLWSQARGEAVVGTYTDTELTRLPMQLLTFKELKEKFPNTKVLSSNTGYSRNYGLYPYGDYETNDEIYSPVEEGGSKRFHAKEIMYVVNIEQYSLALKHTDLDEGENDIELVLIDRRIPIKVVKDGGEINVIYKGESLPGYYEMWFSWATHHEEDGLVWEKNI